MIRPFDGPRHQLRIEHDIQRINTKMMLCFKLLSIDLDHIAQALERMEGKADRQDQGEVLDGVIPVKETGHIGEVGVEEIKVFKDEEDRAGRDDTHDEIELSPSSLRPFDEEGSRIIDGNRERQHQDINRDEGHIKDATGRQKKEPPVGMGDQEIEDRHRREKDEE